MGGISHKSLGESLSQASATTVVFQIVQQWMSLIRVANVTDLPLPEADNSNATLVITGGVDVDPLETEPTA